MNSEFSIWCYHLRVV